MLAAFTEVFRNLRSNFFQTFLSVLGIIIGVGALVAMLSMIDGLEQYARETIAAKSSLENLSIRTKTGTRIDGIFVERDTLAQLDEALMADLLDSLPAAKGQLFYQGTSIGFTPDSQRLGIHYQAVSLPALEEMHDSLMLHGRQPTTADAGKKLAFINHQLAQRIAGEDSEIGDALGRQVLLFEDSLTVMGVLNSGEEDEALRLFTLLPSLRQLTGAPKPYPDLVLALEDVHEVLAAQEFANAWLERRFADIPDATETRTQQHYLKGLAEGVLVFRLIMGFIIGIAVVVGGIGVMNVLLMSIAERTPEIGVRKAVGASRGNIVRQFLSESVAISFIGSFFGILLGMGVALIAAPVLNLFIDDLNFRAVFTLNTVLVVGIVALLIGVLFGTYPARKAASLDPVEAIRR